MALLTEKQRKARMKYLGYSYDEKGIKALQKKYFTRSKDIDGKYGTDTDRLLRHVYNVTKHTKNFKPEEFKCECGGKYCTGYPSWMKMVELKNLQSIRDHYGKPMTVTCGLRCKTHNNKLSGSIPNSKHLKGYACDFYMQGVTDTLANRKKSIKYIKTLPNHNYTYGDGYNSNGYAVSAPYMGNAMHTDTNQPKTTTKKTTKATNADKLVAMAKTLAWPKGTAASKYKYPSGSATDAFKTAIAKAYPNRSSWSAAPRAGASCDVFVGTCVRYSGVDSSFPRGLSEQMPYKSSKFTRYVYKNAAPKKYAKYGDVIMYTHSNGTHIIIKGDGCYYEANYKKKYGHVNTTGRLGDKMKKVIILRPKG